VSVEAPMRNGIRDPRTLEVGQRLAILGARRAPREPSASSTPMRSVGLGWPYGV
jgi:hypothetical protein